MASSDIVKAAARRHGIDPALVCAVVEQESDWNPWAMRHEPAFLSKYVESLKLPVTESIARATSWGLMQVMGQVARELGFTGPLVELCDPEVGVEYGCRKLEHALQVAGGDKAKALLVYNGGADSSYPAKVLARVKNYQ